jgi:WD40 repeat protein
LAVSLASTKNNCWVLFFAELVSAFEGCATNHDCTANALSFNPKYFKSNMETAIRWSPSSTTKEQRFLYVDVIGKSFKLCRVTSVKGNDLEYDVLSTHIRVPGFRAFDWSAADESLIAVGQSSGEVNILRMDGNSNESWSFPLRNQRYCNAVAFSSHGLLAGGLDKVRNDVCLNVWDVNHRIMTGSSRGTLASDRQGAEPLRKLSSDPITSIKFFREQPDTLVAGVKGQFLKLFDLRGVLRLDLGH